MGGVDITDATGKVLEVLADARLPRSCRITVVLGPHAPWLDQVRHLAKNMPLPTEVKYDVTNMAQLMADSDLAIGAAGSTSWERCALGLPSVIGVLADNQTFIADALASAGASKIYKTDDGMAMLAEIIATLARNPAEVLRMSKDAANITDGGGTSRVAAAIGGLSGMGQA